jgi:hypothetical protein
MQRMHSRYPLRVTVSKMRSGSPEQPMRPSSITWALSARMYVSMWAVWVMMIPDLRFF